jgi:protein-arginine kinase activator protein McsA
MGAGAAHQRYCGHHALMSPDLLIFAYVTLLLGGLVILSIYGGIRRRRFRQTESEDRIFRCDKCGLVYTDDPDVDRSRCSQCGKLNEAFKF